jgi:hypothetical protein
VYFGAAGKVCFAGFMKRYHKLNLRQPELTSLARDFVFNEVAVHTILDVLENIAHENRITDSRIFSMDETSHTVVQRPERIMSQKDSHEVGAMLLCERRQNISVCK